MLTGTVLEELNFTVYLGDIPEDVELTSVQLNGNLFEVPLRNVSTFSLEKVVHLNDTRGYILKVPFEDAAVIQKVKTVEHSIKCFFIYLHFNDFSFSSLERRFSASWP